ncbi:MAG: permease [Clostridiaceae bacterium]|nr:permease [Clostridiaceae bacterium]
MPGAGKKKQSLLRRYAMFLILAVVYVIVMIAAPDIGVKAIGLTWDNILEMLLILPPVFVLLGLLDVWVPREVMIRLTGPGSGLKGIIIALMLGSLAAGPLYAAFPVAGIMLKKGTKISNIMIFVGAWSTTKIPLLLFEASSLGSSFMLLRFALNIPVIFLMAWLVEKSLSAEDIKAVYKQAEAEVS